MMASSDKILTGLRIGVIGGGTMASSIIFPLIDKDILDPKSILVSARSLETLKKWEDKQCNATLENSFVLAQSDIVIWAVKPQSFHEIVAKVREKLIEAEAGTYSGRLSGPLQISIMAGLSLNSIVPILTSLEVLAPYFRGWKAVRVMPNMGMQVSCGVAVYTEAEGRHQPLPDEKNIVRALFEPLGFCFEVNESQINSYCGLSGSGIGFMFPILEALSDGAVAVGIPRDNSMEIAAQVMKGAGELYLKTKVHPAILKDMVCSPQGTTIAGIGALENGGVRSSVMKAVEAATLKGQLIGSTSLMGELGKGGFHM